MLVSVTAARGFEKQAQRKILAEMRDNVLRRIIAGKSAEMGAEIGVMLKRMFDGTPVARALRGQGGTDLPAHFGLPDAQAAALADNMGEVLVRSPKVLHRGTPGSVEIVIRAVESDWREFLVLPNAGYTSRRSGIRIPVMEWLLIDPNIDIGQAAFSIVFSGGVNDETIRAVSRSGRAIMLRLGLPEANRPYVLPAIVQRRAGRNFVEFVLGTEGVAKRAADIVFRRLKQ